MLQPILDRQHWLYVLPNYQPLLACTTGRSSPGETSTYVCLTFCWQNHFSLIAVRIIALGFATSGTWGSHPCGRSVVLNWYPSVAETLLLGNQKSSFTYTAGKSNMIYVVWLYDQHSNPNCRVGKAILVHQECMWRFSVHCSYVDVSP